MVIYLFDEYCESAIESFKRINNLQLKYKLQPEKNLELLNNKRIYLIDVFNTFIEPIVTTYEDMIYTRSGTVAFAKIREPRDGFRDFLRHYHNKHKKIGIHSDTFTPREMKIMKEHWNFGKHVDKYFDKIYFEEPKNIHVKSEEDSWIKDFDRMIKELNGTKKESLIISDGGRDILSSLEFKVDMLIVPTFKVNRKFDYKVLIPK